MVKKANLILTDSSFNVFSLLAEELKGKTGGMEGKNLIFCDEKVSLMAERTLLAKVKGSFNTDVYSFGNFLRAKKAWKKILSKEGASMVVKRVLSDAELRCFSQSRASLAPSLYELIIQLKSARITPKDLRRAAEESAGILKNKLSDIAEVFDGYEKFLAERQLEDQSSMLSYLPEIIKNDTSVRDADVYLVGFASWTKQARSVVEALLKTAKSVTAILTDGNNRMLFVGETAKAFRTICRGLGAELEEKFVPSAYSKEGDVLKDNIFNPSAFGKERTETDNVFLFTPKSARKEAETVAELIKASVMAGKCRYKDVTVAVSQFNEYKEEISSAFDILGIPYFIDEKKKPENHPLITLIISYIEAHRKNLEREALAAFFKNPLFCEDKSLADGFENYIYKYNINYGGIKRRFVFEAEDANTARYEEMRQVLCTLFESFDIKGLLNVLDVENKLAKFSVKLKELGEDSDAAVNDQIYDSVINLLDEMRELLGDTELSLCETKNVFLSGVMAMELSIIPQYNDAVFIGDYRQCSLARPKYLFAMGLNEGVPEYKEDVALLSDGEISRLSDINLLVEPKIMIVNHRVRESAGLALSAFTDKLFLSYPVAANDGKKKGRSEIIFYADRLFTLNELKYSDGYLTEKQGLITFARECGEFSSGARPDISDATAYYRCVKDKKFVDSVLACTKKEIKLRLDSVRSLVRPVTSPTAIEDFYKCPYRAFASHVLRLKDRETGQVDGLSVGNFMHAILDRFVRRIDEISCEEDFTRIFGEVAEETVALPEYERYLQAADTATALKRALREAEKFCRVIWNQFKNSLFRPKEFEKSFVIPLTDKVKLKGKVDRIDSYGKYYRVVDYKTGKVDSGDKALFSGTKLQLYLYAKAFDEGTLAGAYYMPINDEYVAKDKKASVITSGKTLADEKALFAQDCEFEKTGKSNFTSATAHGDCIKHAVSEEVMNAYVEYAVKISRKAIEEMCEGIIVPSPYDESCKYCSYKGLCGGSATAERKLNKVDEDVIYFSAIKGNENAGI